MQSPHALAYDGNLQALQAMPLDPRFQTLNDRGQSVLYAACRSPSTSPQLVAYLIDVKKCDVNFANGPKGAGSLPQHAVVQSLQIAVSQMTPAHPNPPPLISALLEILNILRTKGANMSLANTQYQKTALEEFQVFEHQMKHLPAVAQLVPHFVNALTPSGKQPLPTTPPTYQKHQLKGVYCFQHFVALLTF
jgi:hypothetical protein